MADLERRKAARSLFLSGSLARRVDRLRREAEAFFEAFVAKYPLDPEGWQPILPLFHPDRVQRPHYDAVLAMLPKIERAMKLRRYAGGGACPVVTSPRPDPPSMRFSRRTRRDRTSRRVRGASAGTVNPRERLATLVVAGRSSSRPEVGVTICSTP